MKSFLYSFIKNFVVLYVNFLQNRKNKVATNDKIITFRLPDSEYQKILECVGAKIEVPGFCRDAIKRETTRQMKSKRRSK